MGGVSTAAVLGSGGLETFITKPKAATAAMAGTAEPYVDSFAGASDDEKLDAAISYAMAQTTKRPVLLDHRTWNFLKANRSARSGLGVVSPFVSGDQVRGANSISCQVNLRFDGPWFVAADSSTFDLEFGGFGMQGNGQTQFLSSGGNVVWTSRFHDIGATNMKALFGTPATPFINDACIWDGYWNSNNSTGSAFVASGADSSFFMNGGLFDTQPSMMPANLPHMIFNQQSSTFGSIYMTAEGRPGIRFTGNQLKANRLLGVRIEGRNSGKPSSGGLIDVQGGTQIIIGANLGYATGAFITQSGGSINIADSHFYGGSGSAHSALAQTGGAARLHDNLANFPMTYSGSNVHHDDTAMAA